MTEKTNAEKLELAENVELLAPAGDMERLKYAITYGADAVYFGSEEFSLRAKAQNFNKDNIQEALDFCHERSKKAYMTVNIYAHNDDIPNLYEHIETLKKFDIDAFIVSDPGVISIFKKVYPEAELHLSTQANTTNYEAARFWADLGIKRIVLARELSLSEISKIRSELRSDVTLEAFCQGAMCISYSGRCLLSNFLSNRDANKGECSHPCRWEYSLVEKKRENEYYPVVEDDRGTYIMNSKDLSMIEHIDDLIDAGVGSLKIEGRMKTAYYVATVVHAYRLAIDAYIEHLKSSDEPFKLPAEIKDELTKISHRDFTTGFYYGLPDDESQNYVDSSYIREYSFIGIVKDYDEESGIATVEQRNKFSVGDTIEITGPDIISFEEVVDRILDEDGNEQSDAPHPQQILKMKFKNEVKPNYILRKKREA